MEKDNLTDAIDQWEDKGVNQADLAAVTLYRDFLAEVLKTDNKATAARDAWTELIQIIQGDSLKLYKFTKVNIKSSNLGHNTNILI